MMSSIEIKKNWNELQPEILSPIPLGRLLNLDLHEDTTKFLIDVGLPKDAAPFLSFAQDTDDNLRGIHSLKKLYSFLEPEFDRYIVIGSCGDGNPIVIDKGNNCQIEYLDHEDYFAPHFFNKSVQALSECLLVYQYFFQLIVNEDRFYEFADEQFQTLQKRLREIDERAYNEGFWNETMQEDLGMRSAYRK